MSWGFFLCSTSLLLWKGLLGFNVICLIRKRCKCTGCLYTGQIPVVLLSIVKMDINYSSALIQATLQGDFEDPFGPPKNGSLYPLFIERWPCGLIWSIASGRSLDVSVPNPCPLPLSLESLPQVSEPRPTCLKIRCHMEARHGALDYNKPDPSWPDSWL